MAAPKTQQPAQRAPQRVRRHVPEDRFYIDTAEIPEGMEYQWVSKVIMGEVQTENLIIMREAGWESVTWDMRPAHVRPPGMSQDELDMPCERAGMILMSRPKYLGDEARAEETTRAREQVRDKLAQLGQSDPQNQAPRKAPVFSRTYGPGEASDIPE